MNKKSNKKFSKCPKCDKQVETLDMAFHIDSHPTEIFEWLYLGNYLNATDIKVLQSLNIKFILNCAAECKNIFENEKEYGIEYLALDIKDATDFEIEQYFEKGIEFINKAKANKDKGNLFVHCQLGKSRSTSIVIAYLIKEEKYSTDEAYKFLKKKRKAIMPNLGFMNKLRLFEKSLQVNEHSGE